MYQLSHHDSALQLSPTLEANEVAARKRQEGQAIYQMGFGQSPFPVPQRLIDSLYNHAGKNYYAPTAGIEDLCDEVLKYYARLTGINSDDYDVIVAPGSKLILFATQLAVEGDLLMPVPSWVSYAPQAQMIKTQSIKVPAKLDDQGFHIDPDELRTIIHHSRENGLNPSKIILNYPSNPTGLTIPDDELKAIAQVCVEEGILIISDEIYGLVSFDGVYRTIASYAPDNTLISTGLSKHLSLGGWRVGVALIPKKAKGLFSMMRYLASELWSCVPVPIQFATAEAYRNHEEIDKHIQDCTSIHAYINHYIAQRLSAAGANVASPQGAFYTYPKFENFREAMAANDIKTSRDWAKYLIEHQNVVALPGVAFGEEPDVLALRLSGCDYDGAEVLQAYQQGEALDQSFLKTLTPNVISALDGFDEALQKLS